MFKVGKLLQMPRCDVICHKCTIDNSIFEIQRFFVKIIVCGVFSDINQRDVLFNQKYLSPFIGSYSSVVQSTIIVIKFHFTIAVHFIGFGRHDDPLIFATLDLLYSSSPASVLGWQSRFSVL